MKNFKNILVALDLTEMDNNLLRFAGFFSKKYAVDQLSLAHIIPSLVLPEGVKDIVHSVVSPGFQLDSMVREKMNEEIQANLGKDLNAGTSINVIVEEGKPFKNLVKICKQTNAELLLVGKKKSGTSGGIVSKMVARMVECAVCFVTENASPAFTNILVPMDFSDYSMRAIQLGRELTADAGGAKITALHILDYPPTAEYLTRKYGLLAPDWENRLEELFLKTLERHHISGKGIEFIALKNEYFDTAQHIREFADSTKADIILMGAKGHHAFDDLFLGSVTEKLVTIADTVPVLIVR